MIYIQTKKGNLPSSIDSFRNSGNNDIKRIDTENFIILYELQKVDIFVHVIIDTFEIYFIGRIDNFLELKKRTHASNAKEILYILIEKFNINSFQNQIIGSFSIFIYNKVNYEISIISDYYSLQQTYYSTIKGILRVSTRIEYLIESKDLRCFNLEKIAEYFSPISIVDESGLEENTTYFNNIFKVPSASIVKFDLSSLSIKDIKKYWIPSKKLDRKIDYPEISDVFINLFSEVTQNYISSYQNLGVELSGGIDSSSLICLLLNQQNKNVVNSFTLVGGTETWYLEQRKIELIKNQYPTLLLHFLDIEVLYDYIENSNYASIKSISQPNVLNLPSALGAMFLESKNNNCDVLLSGEGADWFLEGTDFFFDWLYKNKSYSALFENIRVLFKKYKTIRATKFLFSKLILPLIPEYINSQLYIKEFYDSFYSNSYPEIFKDKFKKSVDATISTQFSKYNTKDEFNCWNQRLEHELMFPPNHNWQSLNNDNNYILPYLDKRIIEFGLSIPPDKKFTLSKDIKTYYGSCKKIQREAFKGIVPQEVIDSRIKSVYSLPVSKRFEEGMYNVLRDKTILLEELGIIDITKCKNVYEKIYLNSKSTIEEKNRVEAWLDGFLNLEYWIRFVINSR